MQKLKVNDDVIVLSGRDRGRRGRVRELLSDGRVIVTGIHRVKKHVRANPQMQIQGGIEEKEAPIQRSNIALYDPSTQKPARVGIREENGRKIRFFKGSKNPVDGATGSTASIGS